MKKILYAILLLSALVVLADETWGQFRIRNDGTVQFENLNFQTTVMFGPKWLSTAIVNPVLKKTEKQIRFHGSLEVPGQDMTGVYEYSCTSDTSGGFHFSGSLTFPAPLSIRQTPAALPRFHGRRECPAAGFWQCSRSHAAGYCCC